MSHAGDRARSPRVVWYAVDMLRVVFLAVLVVGCNKKTTESTPGSATGSAASRSSTGSAANGSAANAELYKVRGKVVELADDEVYIHHEAMPAIRGFDGTVKPMASMTMPFGRNTTSFDGLAAGSLVEVEFTVHYDSDPTIRLTKITKLPPDTTLELP